MSNYIPQIIMIILYAFGVSQHVMRHGEQRRDKYNGWAYIIGVAGSATLLWWGGFWSKGVL